MKVLGLSFDYHDAAAALLVDGVIVAASQEERFSQIKHDPSLPIKAIEFCLASQALKSRDLDHVVFYEQPLKKFDRIFADLGGRGAVQDERLWVILEQWLVERRFEVKKRIAEVVDVGLERIHFVDHHQSHAASAFFCSPFEKAAVLTMDGVGEWETSTLSLGDKGKLEKIAAVNYPNSLGLFYSAMTSYLGFKVNDGEYKVMGMAPYGAPKFIDELMSIFEFAEPFGFDMDQKFFDFHAFSGHLYTRHVTDILGPEREIDSGFDPDSNDPAIKDHSRHFANVAASVQKCTEEILLKLVAQAISITGEGKICLSGGVALNSVANGRIQRELGCELYIQPAAGDAGGAIGAALYHYRCVLEGTSDSALKTVYLGSPIEEAAIVKASSDNELASGRRFEDTGKLIDVVAEKISSGDIIGWCQGRAEWGPRALGNRSILANPAYPEIKDIINKRIKFREPFRPFAPSVLADRAEEYFEIEGPLGEMSPESFMLSISPVRPEMRSKIPAVTHVDGSARVHLVYRNANPMFYDLISRIADFTGIPIVLNTSFNLNGKPIANTPTDAIETFLWCDLDALVLGNWLFDDR